MRDYSLDLQKLGLSDKEAKVFLAALMLGPETAQNISKQASVNRATTYVAIKSLAQMGLVSSFAKDKKQYFTASSPDNLLDLYDKETARLAEKKALIERLRDELKSLYQKPGKQAVVKYYEGKEGMVAMVRGLLRETSKETVRVITPADLSRKLLNPEERKKLSEFKVKRDIKTKVLYTQKEGGWESTPDNLRKKISVDKFPLTCDIAIYPNKVRIATLGDKVSGIVIEDKNLADTLRSIFELAWESVEKPET